MRVLVMPSEPMCMLDGICKQRLDWSIDMMTIALLLLICRH